MSIENLLSEIAEPLRDGEGQRSQPSSNSPADATSDGVVADGMIGNGTQITREICRGEAQASTGATSPATDKGVWATAEVGAAGSSVDLWDTITQGEQSGSACIHASKRSEGPGDGRQKRIKTPAQKLRKLQIALYRKAKAEPKWRFYSLYGEICREEILLEAVRQVRANKGSAGVDGMRPEEIENTPGGIAQWVRALSEELKTKSYKASAIRRVWIPKADGSKRPLGIPTVKDRVVQTALLEVLMPIYEADFHPHSFGYRPKRSAQGAMEVIKAQLHKGRTEVVDADLSAYFDNISHRLLMRQLVKRVADGSVLALIKQWLRAPILEEGEDGKRRVHGNRQGTPQGGVISPLLANIFLSDLDHGVNEGTGCKAVMVRYADDLVILSAPGEGAGMKERLERWLERRGLRLNAVKTRVLNAREEGFEFLGWQVTPRQSNRSGARYHHMEPSMKSRRKLMDRIREVLNNGTRWRSVEEVIRELNSVMRGWSGYFRFGHSMTVFRQMHERINERLRTWLWQKHSKSQPKYAYTRQRLREQYGLFPMNLKASTATV